MGARGAEPLQQRPQALEIMLQHRAPVCQQGVPRGLVGHERVAVAVAADPGAELKEGRDLELLAGITLLQGPLQPLVGLRDARKQGLLEELQTPGDLLGHRGLAQA